MLTTLLQRQRFRVAVGTLPILLAIAWLMPVASVLAAPPGWELRNGAWVPIVEPSENTPQGQVALMIHQLAAGHDGEVIHNAKQWLKAHKHNPLAPQVLLLQGDAELARGDKYAALFPYENLLNNFPTSELYPTVLQREYDIANAFLKGYKRKFLGLRILPATGEAIEVLDRLQDRQRGSPLAEQAGIRVADYEFQTGEFLQALDAYDDFLRRYPYSQYVRKAEIRRAEASLANFRGVHFDITPLLDARQRMTAIVKEYPQTAEQIQAQAVLNHIYELQGKNNLEIARYYWRASKHHAAAYYYRRVIANWPDTIYAQQAAKELARRMPQEVRK